MTKKVKPQAKQKELAQLKEQADKVLAKVPEGYVFWCHDGERKAEAQFKHDNSTNTLIRHYREFKEPSHGK
jgi:hypothetical protein